MEAVEPSSGSFHRSLRVLPWNFPVSFVEFSVYFEGGCVSFRGSDESFSASNGSFYHLLPF